MQVGITIGDHLNVSSHQKTPLVMFYLQYMVVHHILTVGSDLIRVHRTGTSPK
jgi:hypothetical protein